MGGLVLRYRDNDAVPSLPCHSAPSRSADPGRELLVTSNGSPSPDDDSENASRYPIELQETSLPATDKADLMDPAINYCYLEAYVFRHLIVDGQLSIQDLPYVEEITDKSKSDFLTRTIILLQMTYFLGTVLARVGEGLSISELELGTVAFVACSALTFTATFQKPKSVESAIALPGIAPMTTIAQARALESRSPRGTLFSDRRDISYGPPRNDTINNNNSYKFYLPTLTMVLFSSVHIAGWSLSFPSITDMWLWRAAAMASTGAPVIFLVLSFINLWIKDNTSLGDPFDWKVFGWLWLFLAFVLLPLLYAVARLILMVEMFRGLAYLPPNAFAATWTANIPHIG